MTIVFFGPSLRWSDLQNDEIGMPPAAQGDIAAAALERPGSTIVLIDGYFRQELAPWHKEILWAMQVQGCRVIGAGSLGAIRAVECEQWGAEPVGVIAGWYRDGTCVDDGDVAVAHGDRSSQFTALTVPLVNLRDCGHLEELRKIPFTDRTWGAIAERLGMDVAGRIRENYVDQKRIDAMEALEVARMSLQTEPVRPAMNLNSVLFRGMMSNDRKNPHGMRPYEMVSLDERLDGSREALLYKMAVEHGVVPSDLDMQRAAKAIWNRLGVPDENASMAWLQDRGMSLEEWWARVDVEARISGLMLWLDVCESGFQSVPRALHRRQFYNNNKEKNNVCPCIK